MAINLYSKASVDSLLTAKLSISSLTNAAATTLNATAPTTNQVLSFDGTQLKWATPAGGATWGSITGTLSSQSDLNTALNARVSTAGDTMDNNAILEFNDTYTNGSLGLTGNAVTLTSSTAPGESGVLNYNQLVLTDSVSAMQVNPTGLVFPDSSVQSTAYTGGGTFVGDRLSIYAGYLYNEQTAANVTALTLAGASTVQAKNLTLESGSGGVLTFSDGTTQSTQPHNIPAGGATGTILNKINSADYNVQWSSASTLGLATLASPSLTGTPLAPTASVGTNTTQIATTAFVLANAGSGGGCNVQTFGSSSTSGSFTWTKPTGAKWVEIYLIGAGGGAGSGTRQTTATNRCGGASAAGGTTYEGRINAAYLGSTETVVIGAGGAGGASVTVNSTNGNNGTAGGNTTFSIFKAVGGNLGAGGTTATTSTGGVSRTSMFMGLTSLAGAGVDGRTTTGADASNITNGMIASGGGAGAGQASGNTNSAPGGAGGSFTSVATSSGLVTTIAGGAGGTTAGVVATNGTSLITQYPIVGTGGGGGYYISGVAGGAGGNGGWPGGGSGGGGSSDNGFNSGAGGNGANGFAVIITYF